MAEREVAEDSDPLATLDALGRKQPKKLGPMEFIRKTPSFLAQFTKEVPRDRITFDQEVHQAIFECACGDQVVYVLFNVLEECSSCDRHFLFLGSKVMVARGLHEDPTDEVATPV